jgi:hypothetical protein
LIAAPWNKAMNLPTIIISLVLLILALPILRRVIKLLLARFIIGAGLKAVGKDAMATQPDAIHLVLLPSAPWKNSEAITRLAQPLLGRGFSATGDYSIPELPGVLVRFLMNAEHSVFACVYEHPKAGTWMELATRYQDGTGATFSMMRDRGIEHRPQNVVVHAPGATPGELLERMLRERPSKPLVQLSAEKIVQLFENAWREQITWQKNKGGLSAKEVARVIVTREKNA